MNKFQTHLFFTRPDRNPWPKENMIVSYLSTKYERISHHPTLFINFSFYRLIILILCLSFFLTWMTEKISVPASLTIVFKRNIKNNVY